MKYLIREVQGLFFSVFQSLSELDVICTSENALVGLYRWPMFEADIMLTLIG